MFALAGMDASSSGVYPNASATAWTPVCSLERPLTATEPYFGALPPRSSSTCVSSVRKTRQTRSVLISLAPGTRPQTFTWPSTASLEGR